MTETDRMRTEQSTPTRTTPDTKPTASKARFALILGGLTAFGPLSIDMYLPALPRLTSQLQASASQSQLTLTAILLGLAFGQLIAGPLSDSVGRRKPLVAGVSLYIASSVLCAVAPTVYALAGFRFLQGLGAAAGMVIARATVRDLYSGTEATRFFSALMLVTGLAPILAPVIGGQVLNYTSWRGVFFVLAAFGCLLLLVTVFALPETKPDQWRQPARIGATLRSFGELLAHRTFLGCSLTMGLGFAVMFTYISGSSFVLQEVYGLSPQAYSLAFASNALGLVAATQINARIVGRVASEARLVIIALSVSSLAGITLIMAMGAGASLPFILGALFVMVTCSGFVMPNTTSLALSGHREKAGIASALLGVAQFVVGASLAPLAGLGGSESPVTMAVVMAGIAMSALLVFGTLGVRSRTR